MDPISAAILAAVTAGITAGLTNIVKKSITDLYNSLVNKILQKQGEQSKVVKAIRDLENEPDFPPYADALQKRVRQTKIDKDQELVDIAQKLLDELNQLKPQSSMNTIQNVYGNGNAVAGTGGNATVNNNTKSGRSKK